MATGMHDDSAQKGHVNIDLKSLRNFEMYQSHELNPAVAVDDIALNLQ